MGKSNEALHARRRKRAAFRNIISLGCGAALAAGAWLFWSEGQLSAPKSWPQSAEALWSRLTSRDDPPSTDPQAQNPADDQDRTTPHRNHQQRRGAASRDDGAIPVIVATARTGDIPVSLDALGTVTSLAMVTVKPQLSGYLTQVAFTEGQMVKRGDFLAQIDPRPYQIVLEQAQGQLARDQALLRNANIDLERYKKLVSEDSIARQQVDTQQSLAQQYQGTIVSDQAQIDTAKLNLDYCHITAPVSGRIGLRQVDQGNYVQAAAGLAVITQLQPISVVFSIPEDDIPMVQQRLRDGASLAVTAYDRSRSTKLATGTLATIDNQIDVGTGTVKLRAQFDNSDEALFPNQFVNVALLVDTEHSDTVVPMAAVQHSAAGTYVYLVKPDSTVALQPVQAGSSSGNDVAILSDLAAGDQVVVDGVDQLRDGSKVAATQLGEATGDRMTGTGTPTDNAPQ